MTISRLSAGNGYAYYTSVTASADQRLTKDRELGDYYLETGTPEGQWVGRGSADLGMHGPVTEAHMRALFGDGLHPNADAMIPGLIDRGMTAQQALDEVRLGRKYARFDAPSNELAKAIAEAANALEERLGRPLNADELRAVRLRQAGIMFHERHGRSGAPHELGKLLSTELSKGQTAVAGFDLTFSAPKSVSLAWALADKQGAATLERAHQTAIERTIAFLESEVIRTRTGVGGVASHSTGGLLATRFRHWESREGDPQLHDHVVIANRVKFVDADGKSRWLTIDSKSLFSGTMNASSYYNRVLADELVRAGFDLRQRTSRSGAHQGMELACIDEKDLVAFSSRSRAIDARTAELTADYQAEHGHEPGTKELLKLRQQATLETRTPKSQASTQAQLRAGWREQFGSGAAQLQQHITDVIGTQRTPPGPIDVDVAAVASEVIEDLSRKQSTWTKNHVATRINIWAAAQPTPIPEATIREVLDTALTRASFALTPTVRLPAHPELLNPDGSSIYSPPALQQYTSTAVLDAEDRLVAAAQQIALPGISPRHFEAAMVKHIGPLDEGQIALAKQVACSENVLTVGIGPAGTGKTTSLKLAIAAAAEAGVRTHGVTVSAAAADQLATSTGIETSTIAKWLADLDRGKITISPGDIILVDEAGMVSARDLDTITRHATEAGAFIRLVGDDKQLQAIGAGGSIRMIASEVGAVRLDQVHRFQSVLPTGEVVTNKAEAEASLALREHGDVEWYIAENRVHGGQESKVLEQVVRAWTADEAAGRSSMMMAGSNSTVSTLNLMAQAQRVAAGAVNLDVVVDLGDGNSAGVGDRIVTRRNDRRLATDRAHTFVKNGDTWTITAVHPQGSIDVVDDRGRAVTLPLEYVTHSTGLGYATTVHRAQGQTVDHARLIVDDTTTRESLYVGLTRGRRSNEVYSISDGTSPAERLRAIAGRAAEPTSARELIAQAQREIGHPAHLVQILADMHQRADQHRYAAVIRAVSPDLAPQLLASDRRPRLFRVLALAEDRGFTPERIIALVTKDLPHLAGQDPTGLVAWRISNHLELAEHARYSVTERPLRDITTSQLDALLATAARDQAERRNDLQAAALATPKPAQLKTGLTVSPWTDRPHGHLREAELTEHLSETRAKCRLITGAIDEVRVMRRELRHEARALVDGSPSHRAAVARIQRLDERLVSLSEDRRAALRTGGELRAESRLRADLTGKDWYREQLQRDSAVDGTTVDVDEARTRWATASVLQRQVSLEAKARTFDADTSINRRPDHAPAWAVPGRGITDPALPTSWRQPLEDMSLQVATAIRAHGAALALETPAWATKYLGAVPAANSPLRERWERLAGEIETWRGLTRHTDPIKALPTPSMSKDASTQAGRDLHVLHAEASDLRRDSLAAAVQGLPQRPHRTPQTLVGILPAAPVDHDRELARRDAHHHQAAAVEDLASPPVARPTVRERVAALAQRLAPRSITALANRAESRRELLEAERTVESLRTRPLGVNEPLSARIAALDAARAAVEGKTRAAAAHQPGQAERSLQAARAGLVARAQLRIRALGSRPVSIDVLRQRMDEQARIAKLRGSTDRPRQPRRERERER